MARKFRVEDGEWGLQDAGEPLNLVRKELSVIREVEEAYILSLKNITPRASFEKMLVDDEKLSIVGRVGHWGSQKVACVCRDFRVAVTKARELSLHGVGTDSRSVQVNFTQ